MDVRRWGVGLLCCGLCACAPGGRSDDTDRLAEQLDRVLLGCPQRLWPGADFRGLQVVLLDHGREQAWVWRGGGPGALEEAEYLGMLDRFGEGPYGTAELDGRPALGLDVHFPGALGLGVHEGFHLVAQVGWDRTGLERGLHWPEDPRPRYLRAQLVQALARALGGEPGALGAAAHWQGELARGFPVDVARTRATDVLEGPARYVEAVGTLLAEQGCEADEEAVRAHVAAQPVSDFREGRDPESYTLGMLAGALLRHAGAHGWEARVARGEPPAALVLEGVAPVAQPDDAALLAAVAEHYAAQNAEVARAVEPFLESAAESDRVLVVVPADWQRGTLGTQGFVSVDEDGALLRFLLEAYASFETQEGMPASLTLSGADVLRTDVCGRPGLAAAVPRGAVREGNQGVEVADERVHGGGWPVEQRTDAHGRVFVCPVR